MSDAFIGEIRMIPTSYAPYDWAFCNGQILPIAQNQALFAVIGSTYGGNWRTTMGVPDMVGRAPLGTGNGVGLTPRHLGEWGGSDGVILDEENLPSHTHQLYAVSKPKTKEASPENRYVGVPFGLRIYSDYDNSDELTPMAYETLAKAGSSYPHENRQPFLAVHFCLCLSGIFPSRN